MLIAGVDEAGRGSLAGPVFAAAVILDPQQAIEGLADSKALSSIKRTRLDVLIKQRALCWAIAEASVEEIDKLNILQATLLAMNRAVSALTVVPNHILIDGNQLPNDLLIPAQAIIKGDSKIAAISAASILAKVARDRLMVAYHDDYPKFSFHLHKAYGTKQHLAEIKQFGVLDVHRKSFNPIKRLIA